MNEIIDRLLLELLIKREEVQKSKECLNDRRAELEDLEGRLAEKLREYFGR